MSSKNPTEQEAGIDIPCCIWAADMQGMLDHIPASFEDAFSSWQDDGAPLDGCAVFIADAVIAETGYVPVQFLAFLGVFSYFALEEEAKRCKKVLVVAGGVDDDIVKGLAERGAFFVADIRREPVPYGISLLYPTEEMEWVRRPSMAYQILWARRPNEAQLATIASKRFADLLLACFFATASAVSHAPLPSMMTHAQYQGVCEMQKVYIAGDIEKVTRFFRELAFGAIGEEECEIAAKALATTATSPIGTNMSFVVLDCAEGSIDEMLAEHPIECAKRKFELVSHCWRYALAMMSTDEDVRTIAAAYDPDSGFAGTVAMLKEMGYAIGADVLVWTVFGDEGVPADCVVDYAEMFRIERERHM